MVELVSYAVSTHQGPYLNLNEDLIDIDLSNNLFMIIDGFGGSNIGDKMARIIVENIKFSFSKMSSDPDSTLPFFFSQKYLLEGNALINAFHSAHKKVNNENANKSMGNKGGASVLCGAFANNILTVVATGNCEAYLYRNKNLSREIVPDLLSSKADNYSYNQTVPMSGIGLFEDLHCQVRELKILKDDLVLFLTDGAYARLIDDDILKIIEVNKDNELDMIKDLFKLANDRGNHDNQSALILQF